MADVLSPAWWDKMLYRGKEYPANRHTPKRGKEIFFPTG